MQAPAMQALRRRRAFGVENMPTLTAFVVHDDVTRRNLYRYQFTPKHHGADATAAQWLPSMSLEEEFAIFDAADEHELFDEDGRLYGVQPDGDDGLGPIGTRNEQVAEFPVASAGEAWHGYPLYPLNEGPGNRRGEKHRPEPVVFHKMFQAGLITSRQRKRLMKGDYA